MRYLLLIATLLFFTVANAQTTGWTRTFIEQVLSEQILKSKDTMIYLDKLDARDVVKMKSSFIINTADFVKGAGDKLKLSEAEISRANVALNDMYDYKWDDGLLKRGRRMARDTFINILQTSPDSWNLLYKKGIKAVYSISKPIFIRDTLCLFYWGVHCGNRCGEGEFALYEKQQGKWVKLRWLYSWII